MDSSHWDYQAKVSASTPFDVMPSEMAKAAIVS